MYEHRAFFYDGRRKQIISYAMSRDGIKEKEFP